MGGLSSPLVQSNWARVKGQPQRRDRLGAHQPGPAGAGLDGGLGGSSRTLVAEKRGDQARVSLGSPSWASSIHRAAVLALRFAESRSRAAGGQGASRPGLGGLLMRGREDERRGPPRDGRATDVPNTADYHPPSRALPALRKRLPMYPLPFPPSCCVSPGFSPSPRELHGPSL